MKVFAHFMNVDEAEYAVREAKRLFGGINAVKIRYREVGSIAPDLPVKSFALFEVGDSSYSMSGTHGIEEPFSPTLYFDSDFADIPTREELDGPRGRVDCIMEMAVETYAAENIAHFLRSAHGRSVTIAK